ncbi:hypothetical protein Sjap_011473 [Stephania japonica]|uniref:Uncharacterized protein n=1 Tax=Stephania japonica TaxID=461633 RepID=A0AAP0JBF9_9MAGN
METLMIDCVQTSLRHFMHRNAIFLCERLCAEFPSELNLQLLASCYLQNNQAYCAYHILKGTQMPQSRYLFAIACFKMDLLSEAEAALWPTNEASSEVPNGAAGHYLLGLIYRYTDRRKRAVDQFKQALSIDPLLWTAYEELCILGAADEANAVYGDVAALCIQQRYLHQTSNSNISESSCEDHAAASRRTLLSEELNSRELKHAQGNSFKDANNNHGVVLGGTTTSHSQNIVSTASVYSTPSPIPAQGKSATTEGAVSGMYGFVREIGAKRIVEACVDDGLAGGGGVGRWGSEADSLDGFSILVYDWFLVYGHDGWMANWWEERHIFCIQFTFCTLRTWLSGLAPPPLCRNGQTNINLVGGESSPKSTVNSNLQAPRRKFLDEGKLRKVSGRLFPDSGPRRSTRLAAEAAANSISNSNSNSNVGQASGNGMNHASSKYLGGLSSSRLSSATFRSVTVRKGHSWASESFDEGRRHEVFDDSRSDNTATTSSSAYPLVDDRSLERERSNMHFSAITTNGSRNLTGVSEFLCLLRTLGEGFRLSCMYRCQQEALDAYRKLSHKQYNTGWVLSQVGKAYFELVDHLEADHAFGLARRASPYSLEGMDVYSTVLYVGSFIPWSLRQGFSSSALRLVSNYVSAGVLFIKRTFILQHLKEEMKLSYLAQELISTDRLASQSWCAIGNCYSLQKDNETALKNFQRAVQLNARFAYGHTLCGHEYVALEDYENGIKCYQKALQIDARHYNAWFGLGMVFLRQEKFEFAEHHFRRAFQINPRSSVIMCYLGTALHTLKRSDEALQMMERAILADRKNPLPMYQKANILMSLERFDEALQNLEELKEHAPRESSVYALMGRIYKRRNEHEKAMLHFGLALDFKPSTADVAAIKSAIEKLHVPDEIEDNLSEHSGSNQEPIRYGESAAGYRLMLPYLYRERLLFNCADRKLYHLSLRGWDRLRTRRWELGFRKIPKLRFGTGATKGTVKSNPHVVQTEGRASVLFTPWEITPHDTIHVVRAVGCPEATF